MQGKMIVHEKPVFERIGKTLGLNTLKGVLAVMPDRIQFSKIATEIRDSTPGGWSLNDDRKYAPQLLKDDPELDARLLSKEKDKKIEADLDLDYYRVNDPEFLSANPEEYKRLLKKKTNGK